MTTDALPAEVPDFASMSEGELVEFFYRTLRMHGCSPTRACVAVGLIMEALGYDAGWPVHVQRRRV